MTIGSLIYFILLALWSAAIAYGVLFKLLPLFGKKAQANDAHHAPKAHAHAPHHERLEGARPRFSAHEGFRSCKTGDELCVEDIVKALSRN